MQTIDAEADRLNNLINDLLDASRIQVGALLMEHNEVSLPALAARVVERFRPQAALHRLSVDFPVDFPILCADEERLHQVLTNLLSNAIKYSPDGGSIRVGGWAGADAATIYVADQGIGIPTEEQSRVFERFHRVDSSLRRTTEGAGLGLYLVRSIIQAHGGRIWLRSEKEKGTTVFFTLPLTPTDCHDHPLSSGGQS